MLQKFNAYLRAKIGADTAENERKFAEILPKTGNYRPPRRAADLESGRGIFGACTRTPDSAVVSAPPLLNLQNLQILKF